MHKFRPRPVNMAFPQENFAEYYSFEKGLGPRERLVGRSKWDKNCTYMQETKPKEDAFLRGNAHKFGGTQKAGKLRVSGNKGSHRIGNRSK